MNYSKNIDNIIFFFIFFISVNILLYRYTYNSFPGDLGDTIFSLFILESFYNSYVNNISFSDLVYQFPLKNNIFFSETMWGSAWIYSIFRFLGVETLDSFRFYFITCSVLNYVICYIVLRKFKLSFQSALIASFIFSFSLPIIAQDVRPQLLTRFYIPLSFYFYYRYIDKFELKYFNYCLFFIFFQTLSSMYLGIFLIIFLISMHIIQFIQKYEMPDLNLNKFIKIKFKNKILVLYFLVLIGLFFFYLYNYYYITSIYDFKRGYPEEGLINIFSFLTTDRSFLAFKRILPEIYPLGEQQLYLGISIYLFIIILYKYRKILKQNIFLKLISQTTVINFFLYFSFFGASVFLFLYYFPGLSGLRAPSRSILVIIFPISLIIGLYIDKIFKLRKNFFFAKYLLIFLFLIEILSAKITTSKYETIEKKIQSISKDVEDIPKNKILVFKQTKNYVENYHNDVFFGLYAVINNIKIFNGYTSFIPQFSRPFFNCDEFKKYIFDLNEFHKNKNIEKRNFIDSDIQFINFEKNCYDFE